MELNVPFLYTAEIVRPRCRNPEAVNLLGWLPVNIPEVSAAEAPVVARCAIPCTVAEPFRGCPTIPDGAVEYRRSGDALMRPLLLPAPRFAAPATKDRQATPGAHAVLEPVTAAEARNRLAAWARWALATSVLAPGRRQGVPSAVAQPWTAACTWFDTRVEDERQIAVRHWVSSGRHAAAAEVRAALETGSAFVDGTLFGPSHGPGLVPYYHYENGRLAAVAIRVEPEIARSLCQQSVFRADRLEAACADARRMAATAAVPFRGLDAALEIVDPTAFRHDDEAAALRAAVDSFLAAIHEHILGMDTGAIRAYADLRDLRAAFDGGQELERDALLMAATDLNERWRDHSRRRGDRFRSAIDGYLERIGQGRDPAADDAVVITAADLADLGLAGPTVPAVPAPSPARR